MPGYVPCYVLSLFCFYRRPKPQPPTNFASRVRLQPLILDDDSSLQSAGLTPTTSTTATTNLVSYRLHQYPTDFQRVAQGCLMYRLKHSQSKFALWDLGSTAIYSVGCDLSQSKPRSLSHKAKYARENAVHVPSCIWAPPVSQLTQPRTGALRFVPSSG